MTQANVTDALKPCPFCGNDGSGPIEDALHISFHEAEWRYGDAWSVQCDKCTATMGYSKTKDEAIAEWNTRVTPVAEHEKAQIVAWLRGFHWTHRYKEEADSLADAIEAGEHWK